MAICIYSVGIPILYAALLYSARRSIRGEAAPTVLSRSIAFLYREYEPHLSFWELVEMLRRLLLVGVMVLAQGNMMQLIIGTLLAAVFLLFQVQAAPYKAPSDDFLASAASFCLVVLFLCATAFKYAVPFANLDLQGIMSEEQKDLYIVGTQTLTIITIASTVGALVLVGVLVIVQFAGEMAAETRRKRLQALWQVPTNDPPYFEWRPKGLYTCFLSHYKIEVRVPLLTKQMYTALPALTRSVGVTL